MEEWMETFAQTIDAAKKYVVSRTLDRVDWNAELVRGDLGKAVQLLRGEPGKELLVGGAKLALSLTELGLIDEVRVHSASQTVRPWTDGVHGVIGACRPEAHEAA